MEDAAKMNPFLQLLLIGMASNLDNLGVGLAYGTRRIRISPLPNLVIAAFAFLMTVTSVWVGTYVGRYLNNLAANTIGAVLLIGVGVWVISSQHRPNEETPKKTSANPPSLLAVLEDPETADSDGSGEISVPESLVLGVALGMNCFTNGFAAGLWRLGAVETGIANALFSFLTLWGGSWLGLRYAAQWLGSKATIAAGVLLILIGLRQLL